MMEKDTKYWIEKALELAELSPANKRKVGAIIVSSLSGDILSTGYNQMYDGKSPCENSEGKSFDSVIHAEEDAIMNYFKRRSKLGNPHKTIYVTYSPCINCCKLIAQAGIDKVVYYHEHPTNFTTPKVAGGLSPEQFLKSVGVEVLQYVEEVVEVEAKIDKDKKIALIHHTDNDGLMSGYLLALFYQKRLKEDKAELISYNYGLDDEWLTSNRFNEFIFVDVTPPLDWLLKQTIPITIYDHHKAKFDAFEKSIVEIAINQKLQYTNIVYEYNPIKCGAKLYFDINFDEERNQILSYIIDYINDYDLWSFDLPSYDKIQAKRILSFNVYMQQFVDLKTFSQKIDTLCLNVGILDEYINVGINIIDKIENDNVSTINKGKYLEKYHSFVYEGYPNYWLQKKINEMYPTLGYLIGFQFNLCEDKVSFSIRSKNIDDCDKFAQKFGGNGHKYASGFKLKLYEGIKLIGSVDNIFEQFLE